MLRASRLVMALLLGVGCAGGDVPPVPGRDEFGARLVERYEVLPSEADCVTGFVFDEYNDAAIAALFDEGLVGVPHPYWAKFVHSLVHCSLGDELAGRGGG